jgi:glutamyl/glutaminyl-tRNA synthetase
VVKVRFAPSPTGSLHLGNALSAVANWRLGDWMLLRIDDTDPARNLPGGEEAILRDLEWLGIAWDEGPVRQSERAERHREVGAPLGDRFEGLTLLREDGSPTYHLASVVDDIDFGITHVVRGNDHRPNEDRHRRLFEALDATPPEFVHHGLILGPDGRKLAKRAPGGSVASLRDEGVPAEAVRAYLEELGLPRHDVHLDLARVRRLSTETLAALSDEERAYAELVLDPAPAEVDSPETLARARELVEAELEPRAILRELKAVGGDLKALRLALTGQDRGPELAAVIAALPRDELLSRLER